MSTEGLLSDSQHWEGEFLWEVASAINEVGQPPVLLIYGPEQCGGLVSGTKAPMYMIRICTCQCLLKLLCYIHWSVFTRTWLSYVRVHGLANLSVCFISDVCYGAIEMWLLLLLIIVIRQQVSLYLLDSSHSIYY